MTSNPKNFSDELETWLKRSGPKTLNNLAETFAEKSFAVLIMLLMLLAATPLPTGGITHIFEVITMLLALELIFGFKTIWLPEKLKNRHTGKFITGKAIPIMINRIRWLEKYSRPRLNKGINHHVSLRLLGLVILIFTITAFLAPPFTGLDTIPSMAVVLICLGLILSDGAMLMIGTFVGLLGMGIIFLLATSILKLLNL